MMNYLGRKVKYDLINGYGMTIVPAGTRLTEDHLEAVRNHYIDLSPSMFVVEAEVVEPVPVPVSEAKVDRALVECTQKVQKLVSTSKALFESVGTSRQLPLMEIKNDIIPAVQQISQNQNFFHLVESVKATDDYTYQHHIGVGILSTLIGRWLNLSEADLGVLSLAATLHDIGKSRIPMEILNKPGKLTQDEFDLVKMHTIYGHEMLKEIPGLDPRVSMVALQHHERNEGKGYPLRLQKDQIHLFSRIVAVADIFHAMSSKRPYHDPIPFYEIVGQMRKGIYGELDPSIVSLFLNNIVKRIVGKDVVLTNGSLGQVVYLNPHNIETPLVKVGESFIDLSKRSDLHIKEITI